MSRPREGRYWRELEHTSYRHLESAAGLHLEKSPVPYLENFRMMFFGALIQYEQ